MMDVLSEFSPKFVDKLEKLVLKSRKDLSDREIQQCLTTLVKLGSLQMTESKLRSRRGFSNLTSFLKIMLISSLAVLLSISGFLALLETGNPSINYYSRNYIQPIYVSAIRTFRRNILPLYKIMPITGLHSEECLIHNPFYKEEQGLVSMCNQCNRFNKVFEADGTFKDEKIWNRYILIRDSGFPMVIRNSYKTPVRFETLREVYKKHKHHLDEAVRQVRTLDRSINTLEELFSLFQVRPKDKKFHLEWDNSGISGSHVIRKLFPRTRLLRSPLVILQDKIIFIDGLAASGYHLLDRRDVGGTWYTVGSGKRKIVLTPKLICKDICDAMEVVLQDGDTLTFNPLLWGGKSEPAEGNEDVSISLQGFHI